MRHYHIDIVVNEDEVKVLKEQLNDFIVESDGFAVTILHDGPVDPSPELEAVIAKMFFNLVMTVNFGNFRGIH